MKKIYEGHISGYSFVMTNETTIEVWTEDDNENPQSFIFLKEGDVKTEKDFHMEISHWYLKRI